MDSALQKKAVQYFFCLNYLPLLHDICVYLSNISEILGEIKLKNLNFKFSDI